ncbi:MAG: hypothetical protein V7K32_17680 [Nostoc sp.]|uniref:hypothetical protein n=1 Tax=Nostoc sp. TaxID=1180 RepID=UPI002FF556DB
MSVANPTQRRSIWKNQPFKGLFFIAIIAVISYIFELIFGQIIQLNVGTKLTYITICFVWWWHLDFSLNGYPGSRFSSTRFVRGTVNLVVLLTLVYITGEAWKLISAKAILTDTSVGLWGQTAIIAAAASLFFFDNTIVTTEKIRNWHPISGFLNIFFAIFFIAPALTFLPQMWGLQPFYIPWYWYPCSTVFGSFFERWPLNKLELGMPRLGLLHTGIIHSDYRIIPETARIGFIYNNDRPNLCSNLDNCWFRIGLAIQYVAFHGLVTADKRHSCICC